MSSMISRPPDGSTDFRSSQEAVEKLEARVWQVVDSAAQPRLSEAMHGLLPKCNFLFSATAPTARIVGGNPIRIEFGRDFYDHELSADSDFLFVLLHEIYHHLLGHLIPSRNDKASLTFRNVANIAADMAVNRALWFEWFPWGVGLLDRFYLEDEFPALLLHPPRIYPGDTVSTEWERLMLSRIGHALEKGGFKRNKARDVLSVYRAAWLSGAPYDVILEKLLALFQDLGAIVHVDVLLIGNHDGIEMPGIFDRRYCRGGQAGEGDDVHQETVEVERTDGDRQIVMALRRAVDQESCRYNLDEPLRVPGFVFSPGRRDVFFLSRGYFPVMYQAGMTMYEPLKLAHVYFDVSASQEDELPRLISILNGIRDLITDPIHQFSTRVADVSLARFARGDIETTFGTDFNCVLNHAMDLGLRKMIVFTDGVADVGSAVATRFKASRIELHLVLTPWEFMLEDIFDNRDCPLFPLATTVARLKPSPTS
ncbi:MAG TPA: hypothetical protein PLY68_08940 [Myxococcota bacterium]|nr:hypothetical protein [Myxococcota bacterium]